MTARSRRQPPASDAATPERRAVGSRLTAWGWRRARVLALLDGAARQEGPS